ncbi:hypothetical protein QL285_053399 [Trifolium repens]|nr:hypothetical protein QL285_053399 [Trifolium repens]
MVPPDNHPLSKHCSKAKTIAKNSASFESFIPTDAANSANISPQSFHKTPPIPAAPGLPFKAIMNQNVANFDMDAIAALISAPTTDANSEFHSLTSTHAPNDNEMMNNDDINEDMQDFEDEE